MNPNDLVQALISNRWFNRIPPVTGSDPRTGYDMSQRGDGPPPPWKSEGTYVPGPRESANVQVATPWKDLPVLQKFIFKFLSQPKIPDHSGVDLTDDPTNPLPQPLNPRLQFPNVAR